MWHVTYYMSHLICDLWYVIHDFFKQRRQKKSAKVQESFKSAGFHSIGATIFTRQERRCLPYEGFFSLSIIIICLCFFPKDTRVTNPSLEWRLMPLWVNTQFCLIPSRTMASAFKDFYGQYLRYQVHFPGHSDVLVSILWKGSIAVIKGNVGSHYVHWPLF